MESIQPDGKKKRTISRTGGLPAIEGGRPVRKEMLPLSPPDIGKREIESVVRVLKSGWITRGRKCLEFEEKLAAYTGAGHAVVLSSATAGLFLSLKVNGIGEGDEVVTTPYTFAATANVIIHAGARPVFADIEPGSFLVSAREVEKRITRFTRAIIPVDFAGEPVDIAALKEIAGKRRLAIIEDAAHAIGASIGGKKVGDGTVTTVFSFHAVKNLTTAEGGAVTTNNEKTAKTLRLYSLHGQTKDAYEKLRTGGWHYDISVPGYKYNMTDIQAALGVEQLRRLDSNRKKREAIAGMYDEFFRGFDFVRTPRVLEGCVHARHLYPLIIDFARLRIDRDHFIRALAAENVAANVHYIPLHVMSYYRKAFGFTPSDYPVSYAAYLNEVSLPIYPALSRKDAGDVCDACAKLFARYAR